MKPNQSKQMITAGFIIALGFAAVFFISGFLEKNRPTLPAGFEDEDLAVEGANLKGYALGFEGLLADWYWMKSLQYVGAKLVNSKEDLSLDNLKPLNPRLLYPYLDNATTLDSRFMSVYEYGAVVLPAIDNEQAIKLTRKGIDNNPNQWRLYQHLGYIYWRLNDYENAATVYEKGSLIDGAPIFMKQMAAKMKTEGGSRETAREIYREMFEKSEDAQIRDLTALRLLQLDSLDEREIVQKTLSDFKLKNNRCANNWNEIFPLLKTARLPNGRDFAIDKSNNLVDPSGAPYILDKENCSIKLDENKTKIPLN
jgi:tetratricopeptide (TPR) repeat protein